ncbi:radical SAM protein [Patescibacteria group bacterium]|nr:radical SAM protein [Patescibacteria group bacterium]
MAIRICLVNPINNPSYPPLNLTHLSSYLKKFGKNKYKIILVDITVVGDNIIDRIINFKPDIVAMTSLSPKVIEICELSKTIRNSNKEIFQVCGGAHASVAWGELLTHGSFNVVVIGEGEKTFCELVDQYAKNNQLNSDNFSSIDGIAYKENDKILKTKDRELIKDLDILPHPDRELIDNKFYNHRFYVMRGMNTNMVTTIAGSRGCPFKCIFCCVNFTTNGYVRYYSPSHVVDEVELLVNNYKSKWLYFTDDTFFVNKLWVREICDLLIERKLNSKLKWEVQIRSNLVVHSDLPLLQHMKKAGCQQIDYGLESGNQRILTKIKGTGITIADHERALLLTKQAKIKTLGTFIIGTPSESEEEMLDTKRFIIKNYDLLDRFQVFNMSPYPGTQLYQLCVEQGLVLRDYYAQMKAEKENGVRFYADKEMINKIQSIKNELDLLAVKKINISEKMHWFVYNVTHNFSLTKKAIKWSLARLMR